MTEFAKQHDVLVASLKDLLAERILTEGPITFRDWMDAALYTPSLGYYMRSDRQRWGRQGDYRTSPERSELFAATFARFFANLHERLGSPTHFKIIEYGAGNGAFANDVLTSLQRSFPSVFDAVTYVINEKSEDSRVRIRDATREFSDKINFGSSSSSDPAIVFSNEFLDALPVHRVQIIKGELRELFVGLSDSGEFEWLDRELSTPRLEDFCCDLELKEGQIIEVNLEMEDWLQTQSHDILCGVLVTVDYGHERSDLFRFDFRPLGTLRAFSRHAFVDNILDNPGDYDITSSINWTQLKQSGDLLGWRVKNHERLDQFLLNNGILELLEERLNTASCDAERMQLTTAAREMILPNGMAAAFQILVQEIG